jgi:hypothetical protein
MSIRWNIADPRRPKARVLIEGPVNYKERQAFEAAMLRVSPKFFRVMNP